MSTKAEMCLHATPTVSRAASNDHHMLTLPFFCQQWSTWRRTAEPNHGEPLSRIMMRFNSAELSVGI